MTKDGLTLDVRGAIAAATDRVAQSLGAERYLALLTRHGQVGAEAIYARDVPFDVTTALTRREYGPLLERVGGQDTARAWIRPGDPESPNPLRDAMARHGIEALLLIPMTGEEESMGLVCAEASPFAVAEGAWSTRTEPLAQAFGALHRLRFDAAHRAVARSLEALAGGAEPHPHGVVVLDCRHRVVFAAGAVEEVLGWPGARIFGRRVSELRGGEAVGASAPNSGWRDLGPELQRPGVRINTLSLSSVDPTAAGGRVLLFHSEALHPEEPLGWLLAASDRLAALGRLIGEPVDRSLVQEALRAAHQAATPATPLNDIFSERLAEMAPVLKRQGVRTFAFLRPDLPDLPLRRRPLERVVEILCAQAREALSGSGGTLTVRTWEQEGVVYAAVADDRPAGGSPDFSVVVQGSDGTPETVSLADVRGWVECLGGRLESEYRPGIWMRYTVALGADARPIRPAPREAAPAAPADVAADLPPSVRVRRTPEEGLEVLVVDDNASLRTVLRRYLERRGHRVTEAVHGADGLRILAEERSDFDRILVDLKMPVANGQDFFIGLEEIDPRIRERTIFMTGGGMGDPLDDFLEASGRPRIQKPFDLGEMAQALEA